MRKLKLILFRALCKMTEWRCRFKGMRCGKGCTIDGMPYMRIFPGSKLKLGNNVTMLSSKRHNPLIQQRMNIHTCTPQACLEIADYAGISGSHIVCFNRISIGAHTIIGPDTLIFDWKAHDYDSLIGWRGRKSLRGTPISIGSKCYIGARCIILKGVTIGDHCVVSAGTVVNKDIPTGHLAFGNPMQLSPLPEHLTR